MKKILYVIPFLLLIACGGNKDGLVLDSQNGNNLYYSIHFNAISADQMNGKQGKERLITYYKGFLAILKDVKSRGFAYVGEIEGAKRPPARPSEIDQALSQTDKEIIIPIPVAVSHEEKENFRLVDQLIPSLEMMVKKVEDGMANNSDF